MSTRNHWLITSFGQTYTGQAANVRYTIYDNAGVQKATALGAMTESTDDSGGSTTGTYRLNYAVDLTWAFPLRVKYSISGFPGVVAEQIIGVTTQEYTSDKSPDELILAATVDTGVNGTLTVKDSLLLTFLSTIGQFGSPVRSTSAPYTITVPFLRMDGTTTALTYVTTYTDSTFTKPTGRTFAFGTLPS